MTTCHCTDATCPVHPGTACNADASKTIAKVDFCDACVKHSFGEKERQP